MNWEVHWVQGQACQLSRSQSETHAIAPPKLDHLSENCLRFLPHFHQTHICYHWAKNCPIYNPTQFQLPHSEVGRPVQGHVKVYNQWVIHWYNSIDIALSRWDDRLHTLTFTYLSLWWRINFLCLFLTMFGCFKGLTFWRAIVIPSDSTNHQRLHNNTLYSQQLGLWG